MQEHIGIGVHLTHAWISPCGHNTWDFMGNYSVKKAEQQYSCTHGYSIEIYTVYSMRILECGVCYMFCSPAEHILCPRVWSGDTRLKLNRSVSIECLNGRNQYMPP